MEWRHASEHADARRDAIRPEALRRDDRRAHPAYPVSRMVEFGGFSAFFVALVAAAAAVAIVERLYARRNERRLLREGAEEVAPWVFRLMVPVYVAIFPAAVAEHLVLTPRPPLALAIVMVALFLLAKGLKTWAIVSLGDLWTMRVILPRSLRVLAGGPDRHL